MKSNCRLIVDLETANQMGLGHFSAAVSAQRHIDTGNFGAAFFFK